MKRRDNRLTICLPYLSKVRVKAEIKMGVSMITAVTAECSVIERHSVDVSIVMPCLNERESLPTCIANALETLSQLSTKLGLIGEVVVADNGSTDGSQALAAEMGARVIPATVQGYGAALIAGCMAAKGRYILMGDCDGSYNFVEGVQMIAKLREGYAVCLGSRFDGGIAPGAMPWKNRYIGNPALTGILNLLFRTGINDAHCGLRAIRKEAFDQMRLTGRGMEFASEMVIKAALLKLPMTQLPATLSPDLRDRAPHLRPWRDGWRHLRYLFMLSPTAVFGIPAVVCIGLATVIFLLAFLQLGSVISREFVGESWLLFGGGLASAGHLAAILAFAGTLYGIRQGYRQPSTLSRWVSSIIDFETLIVTGLVAMGASSAMLFYIFLSWTERGFTASETLLSTTLSIFGFLIGLQNLFGSFLLAIISGNEAQYLYDEKLLSSQPKH